MKYLVVQYFKDDQGEWHPPGTLIDLDHEKAVLYRGRGHIKTYQTQAVSPPETRVVNIPAKGRKRNAVT